MSIRTSLILSYLALVVLLTFGMLTGADWIGEKLRRKNLTFTENAVKKITEANLGLSEKILKKYGEFSVVDVAEAIARELSYLLASKKSYSYAAMRRDPTLRRVAVQDILTPDGVAGYTDLLDIFGVSVLHPNPTVEGKNFVMWADEFPEMWKLVNSSFSQPKVNGYYTFIDRDCKKRQKFMALVRVPKTPFVVVAAVNIDKYFLPAHEHIKRHSEETRKRADQAIAHYAADMDRKVKIVGLIGGGALSLIGILFGFFFAANISRPLLRLRQGVGELGEGNFEVAVPEKGAREVVDLAHRPWL
ncbi:MAG: HAMP domain-containing protein [Syntrophobacterales bacterium]